MPRAKKIQESTEGDQTPTAEISAVDGDNVESVDILDDAGKFVRQYSRLVHGDNFAELADSYLAGHPKCHKA